MIIKYKGYELIKAINDGKIKFNTKFIDRYNTKYIYKDCILEEQYGNLYIVEDEGTTIPDYSMFIDNEFIQLEDEVKDSKEVLLKKINDLIEELEIRNKYDKESVKNRENIYRNLDENDDFCKRSQRREIDMANARIGVRLNVINKLKKLEK